jgi:hypothetical protein
MERVYIVALVIGVLGMVAFLGTGHQDSITGFQLYSEGNECVSMLDKYEISCLSPLNDVIAICKTSTMLSSCGTSQGCLTVALEQCDR